MFGVPPNIPANRIPRPNDRVWPATPATPRQSTSTCARSPSGADGQRAGSDGRGSQSVVHRVAGHIARAAEAHARDCSSFRRHRDHRRTRHRTDPDTFSNLLFPGTSVLLTRARYYLFVPWAFQLAAERKKTNPAAILATAANYERSLIEAIRKSGDPEGLIGRRRVASNVSRGDADGDRGVRRHRAPDHLSCEPAVHCRRRPVAERSRGRIQTPAGV